MRKKERDLLFVDEDTDIFDDNMEADRRDVFYSALVKDIVKFNRSDQTKKWIFFVVVCALLILIIGTGMIVIYNASMKEDTTVQDQGIAITGFGSVLSSILILPKIVANHLYPKNYEEFRFDFIKDLQKMDRSIFESSDYDSFITMDDIDDEIIEENNTDTVIEDKNTNDANVVEEIENKVGEESKLPLYTYD